MRTLKLRVTGEQFSAMISYANRIISIDFSQRYFTAASYIGRKNLQFFFTLYSPKTPVVPNKRRSGSGVMQ